VDPKNARLTRIHDEIKIYLISSVVAALGWTACALLGSTGEDTAPERGSADGPSAGVLLIFGLAILSTVRAANAVGESRELRATFGEPGEESQVRFARLRRGLMALGVGSLATAVISLVTSWFADPPARTVLGNLYVGFVIVCIAALVTARGVRRGWIEVTQGVIEKPTVEDTKAAAALLAEQEEKIRKNEVFLSTQQQRVKDIYESIKEHERRAPIPWIPQNLRWALVGFGLGIIGNWLTEPLFKILVAPLNR
jgi:hypothetical protein